MIQIGGKLSSNPACYKSCTISYIVFICFYRYIYVYTMHAQSVGIGIYIYTMHALSVGICIYMYIQCMH